MARLAGGMLMLITGIAIFSFFVAQLVAVWLFGPNSIAPPVPRPAVVATTSSAPTTTGPDDRPPITCAGQGNAMCVPR
jgi:hypothetical protein